MKLLIFLMADAITPVGQIEVLSGNVFVLCIFFIPTITGFYID